MIATKMISTRYLCWAFGFALGWVAINGGESKAVAQWGRNVTVALSGQSAPDGNATLSDIGVVVLNDVGQAAFTASLQGTHGGFTDNRGMFRGTGAPLVQIARKGQSAPGGSGTFPTSERPAINNAVLVLFLDTYLPGGITGIFAGDGMRVG